MGACARFRRPPTPSSRARRGVGVSRRWSSGRGSRCSISIGASRTAFGRSRRRWRAETEKERRPSARSRLRSTTSPAARAERGRGGGRDGSNRGGAVNMATKRRRRLFLSEIGDGRCSPTRLGATVAARPRPSSGRCGWGATSARRARGGAGAAASDRRGGDPACPARRARRCGRQAPAGRALEAVRQRRGDRSGAAAARCACA